MAAQGNRGFTYNQTISSQAMATKTNREDTIIKPSVIWQWQPKPIEDSLTIKPSVPRQWQPKPIEKTL